MSRLNGNSGSDYTDLLMELLPLLAVAFSLALMRGIVFVRRSYMQRNFFDTACNVVFSSALVAALSVGLVLCLPLMGIELSHEVELGMVVLVSAGGVKLVDALLRKRFGLHIVDPQDEGVLTAFYESLTPEQRACHKEKCPFYKDERTGGEHGDDKASAHS